MANADDWAHTLRSMIAERRFRLRFQPIVALSDRAVHHYEALLRPFGMTGNPALNPRNFVSSAESVNLSVELDSAVAEQVLETLCDTPSVSIALNVSERSLKSPAFCDRFLGLLDAQRDLIGPDRLLVELTEMSGIEDLEAVETGVQRLREAGVAVCLDDFGVAPPMFEYVRQLKLDFVKIEGHYVQSAVQGSNELNFVASMVELARFAGARVIAEMIETEDQAKLMLALGVEFGQGWLFGKPELLP